MLLKKYALQRVTNLIVISCSLLLMTSCAGTVNNYDPIKEEKVTVAKVQKEIKIGMSSSDVVEILGSPNIITTDSNRRETWVYDKISTQITSSGSSVGTWFLIFGAAGSKNTSSSNQRTLTIIIKYDEKGLVRDFAYRTSSF